MMPCAIEERVEGNVIEVWIKGRLDVEAYHQFVPLTEERIRQYGKVRMIVVMENFHGWDAGALWEDLKFDAKHFNDIEKLALVGDSKWEKGMAAFCRPFTTAKIKYFQMEEIDAARHWVSETVS